MWVKKQTREETKNVVDAIAKSPSASRSGSLARNSDINQPIGRAKVTPTKSNPSGNMINSVVGETASRYIAGVLLTRRGPNLATSFSHSDFEFVSDFVLRISDFSRHSRFPEVHEGGAGVGVEAGDVELDADLAGDFGNAGVNA